jgi:hypothetical protein
MKDTFQAATAALALLLSAVLPGAAQLPSFNLGGEDSLGADFATMARLFGKHTGFTARSEVRMYDKDQKESLSATMNFAFLENKTRIEIDAARMKNKALPAGIADQLKQMGLDQVVMIIRPDRQSIYVVYPRLEACLTVPLPKAAAGEPKLQKRPAGRETLDGQTCAKSEVTLASPNGEKEELTVWFATDLKDFPVQVLTKQGDGTVTTRYKDIKLFRPEGSQFDLPAGIKEYRDTQSFMAAVTAKVLAGGLPEGK